MIRRPQTITRVPTSVEERLRRAIDDVRHWISDTPRYDVYGHSTTIVQSAAGGADTTLFSQAIQAGSLAEVGDCITFEVSVVYAGNANNKRVRIRLGSTVFVDTGSLSLNGGSTVIVGRISRVSSTGQRFHATLNSSHSSLAGLSVVGGITETLANALNLDVIGNGSLLGDISGWMFNVGFTPRP